MKIQPIKTRIFKEGDYLFRFITSYIPKLKSGRIIVITSKIVALAEGRTYPRNDLRSKIRLIKQESQWYMRTSWTWLTVNDGMTHVNGWHR